MKTITTVKTTNGAITHVTYGQTHRIDPAQLLIRSVCIASEAAVKAVSTTNRMIYLI